MNKTKKKILTIATAGFFTFSTTAAFANEGTDDLGLEIVTETEVQQEHTEQEKITAETPSVLPGDLFYFVKTAIEKIKLALTFNDKEEAKLLATYAMERLAEAEALFNNGDEEKALETINGALEYLINADDKTEIEDNNDAEPVKEDEQDKAEVPAVEDVADDTTDEPTDEVEKLISQNIIALTAALEKVKNPVAKAALQRNIEKSYAKLAKKLEKLEAREEDKKEKRVPEFDIPVVVDPQPHTETKLDVVTPEENIRKTEKSTSEEKAIVKSIKKEAKTSVKEVEKEIKEVKKQLKEEEKAKKKADKFEKKPQKKAAKAEGKAEKSKGKGNNGHNHKGKDK